MCGIVAMIAKSPSGFSYKDKQMFEQMLFVNTVRGNDSTGIFGVNKYGNLKMIKSAKPADELIKTKAFEDFKSDIFVDYRIVVGHNRATTKGATNDTNAHPFIEDHICLVHNGTLTTHKELADTEVDSHAIATAMSKHPHDKVLSRLNGAFALIWYNAKHKKLYVSKNNQRPLWILESSTAQYIASEPGMLEWLYHRNFNAKISAKWFNPDLIYVWDVDKLDEGYTNEEFPKKTLPPPVQTVQYTTYKPPQQSQLPIGTNSSQPVTPPSVKGYISGKRYLIEHTGNSVIGNKLIINGVTADEHNHQCTITISYKDLDEALAEAAKLQATEFMTASYIGYSRNRSGFHTLIFGQPKPYEEFATVTGEIVTLDMIQNAGHCCNECGTIIEPSDDEHLFWARIKGDEIKRMLCPVCVSQHPRLAFLQEDGPVCTNASSSSDTKNTQTQYESYAEVWDRF